MGTINTPKNKPKKNATNTTQMTIKETTPGGEFKYPNTVTAMEKEKV